LSYEGASYVDDELVSCDDAESYGVESCDGAESYRVELSKALDDDHAVDESDVSRSRRLLIRVSPTSPACFRFASCSAGGTGWNAYESRFCFLRLDFLVDVVPAVGS